MLFDGSSPAPLGRLRSLTFSPFLVILTLSISPFSRFSFVRRVVAESRLPANDYPLPVLRIIFGIRIVLHSNRLTYRPPVPVTRALDFVIRRLAVCFVRTHERSEVAAISLTLASGRESTRESTRDLPPISTSTRP